MPTLTLTTEEMFLIVFCLIDDLYHQVVPNTVRYRVGHDRITFTDSEVITLSILQEACSNDSELSFHRLVEKDYRHLFPQLIERSRYHRRRKALLPVQRHLLRWCVGVAIHRWGSCGWPGYWLRCLVCDRCTRHRCAVARDHCGRGRSNWRRFQARC